MPDNKEIIKDVILNGKEEVFNKRQKEIAPKVKKLINEYKKIVSDNKDIFNEYHNSFYSGKHVDTSNELINFFSNELNKLELTEFDLDLVIDDSNMTLLDFILNYKPNLSLDNFSLGGSYTKIGIKFLEKILTSNDKEYIKYLHEIGFYGSPELFLEEINAKKVIDYLIDDYENLYHNFCGIEFNLVINDYEVKEYVLNNIQNGKYDISNKQHLFTILNTMNFTTQELFKTIIINGKEISIFELYLSEDIIKDKLNNVIAPKHILNSLIKKLRKTDNEKLKKEISDCLNNLCIDKSLFENINETTIEFLKNANINLKIVKEKYYKSEEDRFNQKIKELVNILKTGTLTSEKLIKYVIENYINMYNINNSQALLELETLILIKKNNSKFHIEDSNIGPNFDNDTIHLILSDKSHPNYHGEDNYSVFNHEITHAFQYYCYNDNTPRNYYSALPNKEDIVDLVAQYSEQTINKMNNAILNMKQDSTDNKEKITNYISLNIFGYEREVIDIFDTMLCFTDFLKQLDFENADLIEGHPYDYMKYGGYDFSEMLADYKSVMSSDREDLKELIQKVIPKKCISFIEDFNMKMLMNYINIYTNLNHNELYLKKPTINRK
ncbi:MAG: hypothetical protein IKE90_03540 [Bacilli bacterium]|nr:hypothetical protein [Bacilli bacterium]